MQPIPQLVTDKRELSQIAAQCREAGAFAFDTEFIRDDTFEATLCLVQVACGETVWLIDPVGDLDVHAFWELVLDPAVLKIVHAGKEDFDVCLTATGKPPRNIFDVQIAGGFVGLGYPLSLSRLATAAISKRIAKGQTLTDWSRRPLTEEQLRYAVEDVSHLPAIHAKLTAMLEKNGRAAWAAEEFRRFEDARLYQPPPGERLFRIKGTRNLDPLALVALEKLIEWREDWAREKNRPTRAMMRDDILVEIARRRPTRAEQLEVMRGFPQSRNPRIIARILELIAEAKAVPPDQRPVTKETPEESPMTRVVVDVLAAVLRSTCHVEHLDADLVGSTQRLRELLDFQRDGGNRPTLLTGWREEFIGRRLIDVLAGRSELHLSGWPENPHLALVTHKTKTRTT